MRLLWTAIAVLLVGASGPQAPTLDVIVNNHVAALGGATAIASISSFIATRSISSATSV